MLSDIGIVKLKNTNFFNNNIIFTLVRATRIQQSIIYENSIIEGNQAPVFLIDESTNLKVKIVNVNCRWNRGSCFEFRNLLATILFNNVNIEYNTQASKVGAQAPVLFKGVNSIRSSSSEMNETVFDNCYFGHNVFDGNHGGGIAFHRSSNFKVDILNTIFQNNTAKRGGALYITGTDRCTMKNVTCFDHHVTGVGNICKRLITL